MSSIGIVIPTYQAAKHLAHCLPFLIQSPLKPRVLVIDSSSTDQTVEIAKEMGAEVIVIPQKEFNHGTTREMGRRYLKTSIVVMITQDAYPKTPQMLEALVAPLVNKQASVAYARQLPHKNAGFLGSFARHFNYPSQSHIRTINDCATYGSYTFFCSNSCAAYVNEALDEVGGFPAVLFGEDTVCVAKLLHQNHAIAYVAEAEVYHSHDYSLKEEFLRHFDMGLARRSFSHLIHVGGKDTKRGKVYARQLLSTVWKKKPLRFPYTLMHLGIKFAGYTIGKYATNAPVRLKKLLSSQKGYWHQD